MGLSSYHQKYTLLPNEEIQKRADVKKQELASVFNEIKLETNSEFITIAVLGCGDDRYIKLHNEIFSGFIHKPFKVITFDITIEHLTKGVNVIYHDCILPLPIGPFDITYAHVLLKFIETEKQWEVLINSYNALKPGGLAIHILDTEDFQSKTPELLNGLFSVPLDKWKEKLEKINVRYFEIKIKHGLALVMKKL